MVRSYNTDDAAVIWINGRLVGATTGDRKDSNWININDYLLPGQDNIAAFASYNGNSGGQWGFGIRRDDISVWGVEQGTGDDWSFAYAQQVAIHPDGTVEAWRQTPAQATPRKVVRTRTRHPGHRQHLGQRPTRRCFLESESRLDRHYRPPDLQGC
ncbi:hypothetical protein [Candidatus Amarolinea dominans]|uniref:hypothetical protein n=1 Tax=Candidatus Amarolinea dominans TaxID=3140696 RepID=UPI001E12D517|nr:hypothetical protein [Anaerolineae bacterium]